MKSNQKYKVNFKKVELSTDPVKGSMIKVTFTIPSEQEAGYQSFFLNDLRKASRSVKIWMKNLNEDLKIPNMDYLILEEDVKEADAKKQVQDAIVKALEALKDTQAELYLQKTEEGYLNWLTYEPETESGTSESTGVEGL